MVLAGVVLFTMARSSRRVRPGTVAHNKDTAGKDNETVRIRRHGRSDSCELLRARASGIALALGLHHRLGAGYGFGKIGAAALEGMARQPEVAGQLQTGMIVIAALLEGATFFAAARGVDHPLGQCHLLIGQLPRAGPEGCNSGRARAICRHVGRR